MCFSAAVLLCIHFVLTAESRRAADSDGAAGLACRVRPRSRALKLGLIRFFFYPEQYFPLTNSSRISSNHSNSSRIIPSERDLN